MNDKTARLFAAFSAIFAVAGLGIPVALHTATLLPYHVTAASSCYAAFIACSAINIALHVIEIRKNKSKIKNESSKKNNHRILLPPGLPVVLCDIGICFAAETLITGMIWAKTAWGAVWVWDPRLSGMLLMTLVFTAWRLSCAILGPDTPNKIRYTAPLLILGLPSMFFTHFAVRLFGGIHPESVAQSGAQFHDFCTTSAVVFGHAALAVSFFFFRLIRLRRCDA